MVLEFKPVALSATQRKKAEKLGINITSMAEADRYYGGPELKCLALEYLLCSNVFLLSRFYHLFGEEKNGKSTLAVDWLNRYFLEPGGSAMLAETENKLNTELFRKMLGDNYSRLDVSREPVLEKTTATITEFTKALVNNNRKRIMQLAAVDVDSLRVLSGETVDKTQQEGAPTRNYAIEAGKWRTFLGSYMPLIQDMPIALIGVNHAREEAVEGTSIKTLGCGGGKAIKFYESYRILVKTTKRVEQVKNSRAVLQLTTKSNTNGPVGRKIYPEIVYRSDGDSSRVYVDWDAADAELLSTDDGNRILRSKLYDEGVCAVKASSEKGLYNDEILGLKKVPIQEITAALYADSDRLAKFREIEQIAVYKNLEQLYEAGWFFDAKKLGKSDDEEE